MKRLCFLSVFTFLLLTNLTNYLFAQIDSTDIFELLDCNKQIEQLNELAEYALNNSISESILYSKKAIELAEKNNNPAGKVYAMNTLGASYMSLLKYDEAFDIFMEAKRIADSIDYKLGLAKSIINLGDLNTKTDNFEEAFDLYNTALLINEAENINNYLILSKIGDVHFKKQNYNNALKYYFDALNTIDNSENEKAQIHIFNNIGNVYIEMKDYSSAELYFRKAQKNAFLQKYWVESAEAMSSIGYCFRLNGKYKRAIALQKKALELALKSQHKQTISKIYKEIAESYLSQNDYKTAFIMLELYANIQDSFFTENRQQKIDELNIILKATEKEKENEALRIKNQIQQLELKRHREQLFAFIAFCVFAVIQIFILIFRYREKSKSNKILLQQKQEIEIANSQLREKNSLIEKKSEELRVALEKITKSEEQLQNSVALKDKMLSIISHDLRNLVGNLEFMIGILLDQYSDRADKDLLEILIKIKHSARSTFNLLENLLNWAKSQRGTLIFLPKILEINVLINETIELFSDLAESKNIELYCLANHPNFVFADQNMIATVLRNLVSNAIKFTPDNGEIALFTKKTENSIEISVKDSGIGVDEEKLGKLFKWNEVFTTAGTNNEQGSGLGLILCRDFVEKNQGKIWTENKSDGTVFTFSLPMVENNCK